MIGLVNFDAVFIHQLNFKHENDNNPVEDPFCGHPDQCMDLLLLERNPAPVPDSSNFCSGITGFIRAHTSITTYTGDYAIVPATVPPDLLDLHDSLAIQLTQTTTSGGGFGNGLGIIHELDCSAGTMILIQADLKGFGQHLYRFYHLKFPGDSSWFIM